ncbi:MAG: Hsp20/alpha crystallin family protein [Bacteroidetes bacterium]|nr:Hsp20/alpha crystallin family protein [Bacteroidota bacterium]
MFDGIFNDSLANSACTEYSAPNADIIENEKQYELQVALPGFNKKDVNIEVEEGKLTISGERKFEKEDKGNTYHTIESQYGKFTRTFYLPDNVKDDAMKASYKDGILKVVIPKDEKKVVKNVIEIN